MSSCRTPSTKVVNRLGQLRADKIVRHDGKVREVKTFPARGGLYAEVASRFTPSNKVVRRVEQLQAAKVVRNDRKIH